MLRSKILQVNAVPKLTMMLTTDLCLCDYCCNFQFVHRQDLVVGIYEYDVVFNIVVLEQRLAIEKMVELVIEFDMLID